MGYVVLDFLARLRKVWSRYDQDGNQVLSVRSPELYRLHRVVSCELGLLAPVGVIKAVGGHSAQVKGTFTV